MKTWYVASTGNHHGLVVEEATGRNVAVTYNKADTPLVSAAPELLEALHDCLTQEGACAIVEGTAERLLRRLREIDRVARAAIARAKGEDYA